MQVRVHAAAVITAIAVVSTFSTAFAANDTETKADGVRAVDGEWIYVEDRTEGRAVEAQQPSMSARVRLRVEEDAVVLERRGQDIRIALDGSPTEVSRGSSVSRYSGAWKDGAFEYESVPVRKPDDTRTGGTIRWTLRVTDEGMLAHVMVNSPNGFSQVALYRHPEDIELPKPAEATIADVEWLAGPWVGTRGRPGTTSIEERWSPPLGGSMLAVSRTVTRGKLRSFEYLRIIERDGGLIYVAQPNGTEPTEFTLTEFDATRAVFENPRHDFPQRIVYERAGKDLTASIGFANGGKPREFKFKRENADKKKSPDSE